MKKITIGISRFFYSARYAWYDFKYGVRNLKTWLPFVWKHRPWDHSYIYKAFEFTLREHAKSMIKGNFIVDAELYGNQMKDVADRFHKLSDTFEYFEGPAYEMLNEKYPNTKIDFVPIPHSTSYTMEYVDENGNVVTNTPYIIEYKKELGKSSKQVRKDIEAYKKETFKIISDNIDHWWW